MASTTERLNAISATLDNIGTEVDKVSGETSGLLAAIADLRAIIAAGGNSTEIEAALVLVESKATSVASKVQAVDALVEDVPTP